MLLFNLNSLLTKIILIISLSSIKSSSNNKNESTESIRFAFELCRHGARTPYGGLKISNFTFKDYFSEEWIGIKELTPLGIKQHFYLGLRNRIKYIKAQFPLLNENYDPQEILVYSTDSNRTILSANAQLQGLYLKNDTNIEPLSEKQINNSIPPGFEENFDEENKELGNKSLPFNMAIVPIHLLYSEDHIIQIQDKKNCKNLAEKYDKRKKRKDLKEFLDDLDDKYSDLIFPLIQDNINSIVNDSQKLFSSDYTLTYNLLDQIVCQYSNGKLNKNIIESFENNNNNNTNNLTIKDLYEDAIEFFKFDFLSNATGIDEEIGLYSLSPIMDMVINYMNKKVEKDKENDFDYLGYDVPKFLFISAHDSTVGGLEAFFKAIDNEFDLNYAYFASNIFIELFNNNTNNINNRNYDEDDYYVRILFDEKKIREYRYKEFYNLIKSKIKDKYEIADYCGYEIEEVQFENGFYFYLISSILLSCLTLFLIMILINLYLKKEKIN